jgi:hypothetical protein
MRQYPPTFGVGRVHVFPDDPPKPVSAKRRAVFHMSNQIRRRGAAKHRVKLAQRKDRLVAALPVAGR